MITAQKWVVLKIKSDKHPTHYRVLAGFEPSRLTNAWRLNSGIVRVTKSKTSYYFFGYSGSCYRCPIGAYGFTFCSEIAYERYKEKYPQIQLLSEDVDFELFDYL